jgi:hypothetical protein
MRISEAFEDKRPNIPPWPTDPVEKRDLLLVALEIEESWRNARVERQRRELERALNAATGGQHGLHL